MNILIWSISDNSLNLNIIDAKYNFIDVFGTIVSVDNEYYAHCWADENIDTSSDGDLFLSKKEAIDYLNIRSKLYKYKIL